MIKSIKIQNYKSFENINIQLNRENYIIGKNAVGKTNFTQAILLMRELASGSDLVEAISNVALATSEVFNFRNRDKRIKIEICFENDKNTLSHLIEISSMEGGVRISQENLFYGDQTIFNTDEEINPYANLLTKSILTSTFAKDNTKRKAVEEILNLYSNLHDINIEKLNMYDSFSFGSTTFRRPTNSLAKLILQLQENPKLFEDFIKIISDLIPNFDSIKNLTVSKTKKGKNHFSNYLVLLKEKDMEREFSTALSSTGDLKTMYIIANLLNMNEGATFVIEELENSLHPNRLMKLLDRVQSISSKKDLQLLITTHNPEIINSVSPKHVILVEKEVTGNTKLIKLSESADISRITEVLNSGGELTDYLRIK